MKHILIVDDSRTNLLAAQDALAGKYKVTALGSGKDALEFLEKETPDLILLDIIMPVMDGFEVMKRIKEQEKYADIPIIFLTADNEASTEIKCLENGAWDFISKPFVPMVMCSRISHTLELDALRRSLASRLDEKIKEVSDMKSKSLQDPLTGLWNRMYVEEAVQKMLQNGEKGSLFMMDMDNFKGINDQHGHIAGDHTLKLFADILKKFSEQGDVLCRMGGDEFVAFIAGEKSKDELEKRAENIIMGVLDKLGECGFEISASVSVGIAQFPEDGTDFAELYKAADKALYYVKQNGKNAYHFYSDQRMEENDRAGKSVDLAYLRDLMKRADAGTGSYILNFENFQHIYNFILRGMERSKRDVQTILFTLRSRDEKEDPAEAERAMEMLENAVFSFLRKVDVSARYSSRQMIVILLDIDESSGSQVARRILDSFEYLYDGELRFDYDIVRMRGEK